MNARTHRRDRPVPVSPGPLSAFRLRRAEPGLLQALVTTLSDPPGSGGDRHASGACTQVSASEQHCRSWHWRRPVTETHAFPTGNLTISPGRSRYGEWSNSGERVGCPGEMRDDAAQLRETRRWPGRANAGEEGKSQARGRSRPRQAPAPPNRAQCAAIGQANRTGNVRRNENTCKSLSKSLPRGRRSIRFGETKP
jgi:hypothetical protein